MKKIYLDNASTTFPKAPGVSAAMCHFVDEIGCNVSRGEYEGAYDSAEMVLDTRERLCALFGFSHPRGAVFTQNVTAALNMVLKGMLRPGDHVLVSAMEHNAVMRPLTQLTELGVSFDRIPCDREGRLLLQEADALVRRETKAVVMTHASNVCGTLMPAQEVGKFCEWHGLRFVLDSAQTAGSIPVEMDRWGIDALCFTGHKGLLGPQGIGGFLLRSDFAEQLTPLFSGGTGSFSDKEIVPALLPDKFEPGTPNLPGIFGLNAALRWLEQQGLDAVRAHELELMKRLTERFSALSGVQIIGPVNAEERAAVLSVDFAGRDNAELAFRLDSEFGIMTRCGLHCAPNAHKTLGTFPQGTVRFSVGFWNTTDEIDTAVEAVRTILES